jgi:hypothetical protein
MNESSVVDYITQTFPGVETTENFGTPFSSTGTTASFPSRRLSFQTTITITYRTWTVRGCFA